MNIILLVLIIFSEAFIQNDYGEYTGFDSNACEAGSSQTKEIRFSSTFISVPKVFYFIKKFTFQLASGGNEAQVKSEILSITTTGNNQNYYMDIRFSSQSILSINHWIFIFILILLVRTAMQNITVIRSDIISNPQNGDVYPHSHSNSLATLGFTMLTDLQYNGLVDFNIYIQSVTSTQVQVKYTSAGSDKNPINIGYFVVIGPSDIISKQNPSETAQGNSDSMYNSAIGVTTYEILFWITRGFGFTSGQPQIIVGITQNSGGFAFVKAGTISPTVLSKICYQVIRIQKYSQNYPMYVNKYRITQIEVINIDFPLTVILNGQTYTQVGKYSQQIPGATQKASVQILMQFLPNKMLQGTLLKCVSCGTNFNYKVKKYYIKPVNMITFNLEIWQYLGQEVKNLEITLSSTGVLIKQTGTVVSDDQATVVNLQFQ